MKESRTGFSVRHRRRFRNHKYVVTATTVRVYRYYIVFESSLYKYTCITSDICMYRVARLYIVSRNGIWHESAWFFQPKKLLYECLLDVYTRVLDTRRWFFTRPNIKFDIFLNLNLFFLFPPDSSVAEAFVAIVLDFFSMGDYTQPEVDSVKLNRLRKLYEEDGFVKSVQEAMKDKVLDNQGKDVRISFGPNEMHKDFANKDIQWPFAVFVIDFAGKCNVNQVKKQFEDCLKAQIESHGYGEESGLMVCCDRAESSHRVYTFYVPDRILLKESLERIVKSYAQDGERDDLLEAIIKCHRETPKSLTLDDNARINVIVQIVSFTEWSGHIHGILDSSKNLNSDLKKKKKNEKI